MTWFPRKFPFSLSFLIKGNAAQRNAGNAKYGCNSRM